MTPVLRRTDCGCYWVMARDGDSLFSRENGELPDDVEQHDAFRGRPGPARSHLCRAPLVLCLLAAEAFLRIKNSSMTNYGIEMWRYSNELKRQSDDPSIDFDHVKSKTATL
jgi:hypothetical protein